MRYTEKTSINKWESVSETENNFSIKSKHLSILLNKFKYIQVRLQTYLIEQIEFLKPF